MMGMDDMMLDEEFVDGGMESSGNTGLIIGIVVVAIALVIVVVVVILKKKKKKSSDDFFDLDEGDSDDNELS